MGIARSVASWLIREHQRRPFGGPALVFGRQHVHVTLDEFRRMVLARGLEPQPLPPGLSHLTDMPSWDYGLRAGFTSDQALLWTLAGIEVQHLDCSEYERAEYTLDLNQPVPLHLHEQYGVVFDCGTMEHVFDIRSTLQNVDRLVRPEGRVIHVTQGSNWLDHGYYQFSPVLFYDFYGVNGYENMACWVADQGVGDPNRTAWDWYRWPHDGSAPAFLSANPVGVFFTATRKSSAPADHIPRQGQFAARKLFAAPGAATGWRAILPASIRRVGRRLYWRLKREERF